MADQQVADTQQGTSETQKKSLIEAQSLVEQVQSLLEQGLIEQSYSLIVDAKKDPLAIYFIAFFNWFLKIVKEQHHGAGQSE